MTTIPSVKGAIAHLYTTLAGIEAPAGARPGDGTVRAILPGEIFINRADGIFVTLDANGNPLAFGSLPAAQDALAAAVKPLAPLASPAFTGAPTAPTAAVADNSTTIATTASTEAKLARGVATPNFLTFSGGPALRSFANRAGDRPDMRDYLGFDTTGNNDNAALMNAAAVDSGANGYEINIPAGTIALASPISTGGYAMKFKGQGVIHQTAINSPGANTRGPGTWLHFAHTGIGIQTVGQPGSSFRMFGTFRDQPVPSANASAAWAPGKFDFDFDFQTADVLMEDICLLNPSYGFRARGAAGRLRVNRVYGHPLVQGCNIQQCYDTNRITHIHWWPYWSFDPRVAATTLQSFIGYIVGRADNMFMSDLFSIQHNVCLYLIPTVTDASNPGGLPGGVPYKLAVHRLSSDVGCCGVLVDQGVSGMDASFTDLYAQGYQGECANLAVANAPAFPGLVTVYGSNNRLTFDQPLLAAARSGLVYVGDGGTNAGNAVALDKPFIGTFNLTGAGQGFAAAGSSRGSVYQGRKMAGFGTYGDIIGPGFTSNNGDF